MFQWDPNNLGKIRAHHISREEAEQAIENDPVLMYAQEVESESLFVYYGETDAARPLAIVVTERNGALRVITAYDLDPGQRREYLRRRIQGQ